jgi:hypothetical protein
MRKPSKHQVVKSLVLMQYAGSMVISFMHIVTVGQRYGLTWEAYAAPFLIDGFMILGAIGRSHQFAEATRKTGLRLMVGAGMVSLVCNVMAGTNVGQRVFGVLVVLGALTAEWYAAKLEKAPEPVVVEVLAEPVKPRRVVTEQERAARKRAGYAQMDKAAKAAWTKAYSQRRRSAAPVSPGYGSVSAPSAADLDALVG